MSFLVLQNVKDHLNLTGTVLTLGDAELQRLMDSAEQAIIEAIGPVEVTALNEFYDGGSHLIKLLHNPVTAVTSVTESYGVYFRTLTAQPLDGSAGFTAYGYTVDLTDGVLIRRVSGAAAPFAPGRRNVNVAYSAGFATTPPNISNAAEEMVRYLVQPQRGSGKVRGQPAGPTPTGPRTGLPLNVEQLLTKYLSFGIG